MADSNDDIATLTFGSGDFEFGEWITPFTNASVEIIEIAYSPKPWPEGAAAYSRANSLLRKHDDSDLVARVYDRNGKKSYRVTFSSISAMRVLDEGGLAEFWQKTSEFGSRPGNTTFRVRNHAWTRESIFPFLSTEDGWSFVIATLNECLEVVSASPPIITEEPTSDSKTAPP